MNHSNFEEWILISQDSHADGLSMEQLTLLNQHLDDCQSCRQLAAAWREVEVIFQRSPNVSPADGFTERWEKRFELDRQHLQARQTVLVLAFCLAATILLFGSLFLLAWPWTKTPDLVTWFWITRIFSMLTIASGIQESIGIFFNTVSGVIPLGGWVLLFGLASELAVLWLVSLRLLTKPRRVLA